jgi:sec-independent protein translocase protein TatC
MSLPEDQKGAGAPVESGSPSGDEVEVDTAADAAAPAETGYRDDVYDDGYPTEESESAAPAAVETPAPAKAPPAPPPPPPPSGESDDEEDGMLRMSFLEHLEELRARIIKALLGVGVAFALSLTFTNWLWGIVRAPAVDALRTLGVNPPNLAQITPMEAFTVVWVKLPILCAIFLASPWVLYQVWAFIAPGLYRRERRWAAPFILTSAGLFIGGGVFAYYVAFRFGLTFLLGIGRGAYITPMVSVTEYFNLFVNVILGVGLVFELPVLIFFLTLLRILTPGFLIRNSRYAILTIFLLAAVVTPTADIFNLMLFAVPMTLLFYVGVLASYLLVLNREGRRFPWAKVLCAAGAIALLAAAVVYLAITKYNYHLVPYWPFLTK